jgi:hypothetical protein
MAATSIPRSSREDELVARHDVSGECSAKRVDASAHIREERVGAIGTIPAGECARHAAMPGLHSLEHRQERPRRLGELEEAQRRA